MIPRVIVSVTAAIVYINYKLGLMGLIEIAVKSARKSIPPQNPPQLGLNTLTCQTRISSFHISFWQIAITMTVAFDLA